MVRWGTKAAVMVAGVAMWIAVMHTAAMHMLPLFATELGMPPPYPTRLAVGEDLLYRDDNGTFVGKTFWPSQWYNKQLDGSTVHLTNVARTQFFDKHIERHPRAGRAKWVLEVGTGDGVVAQALASKGYKVTAVDTALPFLEKAHQKLQAGKDAADVRLLQADATALPFTEAVFDAVVLADVLEHVPQLQTALTEAARVLKTGGSVLVSTINRSPCAYVAHKALWPRVLVGYPKEGHDWRMYVTPAELATAAAAAGLELVESDTTALVPTFWPRFTALGKEGSWHGVVGRFFAVRGYVAPLSAAMTECGPYLARLHKPRKGDGTDDEEFTWFPASVRQKDGTIQPPSEEDIRRFATQ